VKKEYRQQIARLVEEARTNDDAARKRTALFDRYMGEQYTEEGLKPVAGKSSFISSDVADVIEALLPDIMDVFTSAEDIVVFDPVGPEDEAAAKQETAVVSHLFWQKNDGFLNLLTWIKEALIQQIAYVRRGWVEKERVTIEAYEGLSPDELLHVMFDLMQGGAEYKILEQEQTEAGTDIKLRCVKKDKRYEIKPIPQEKFFVTPRWHSVNLEGVPCCGYWDDLERGELIRMGFDTKVIDANKDRGEDDEETADRFDTIDLFEAEASDGEDDATRKVRVYEVYARLDLDGDGKAELVQAWCAGDKYSLLQWKGGGDAIEEVSCVPFSALTPYIVPHRHVGRGAAEQVDDIAKLKTVLWRHMLDNVYATNYPRPWFDENRASIHTYEDLMKPEAGAPIRAGEAEINIFAPPPMIETILPLLAVADDAKELRTGAVRYNQGLDADSLNKTARGIEKIMNASQKKALLVARTIAETGLRDLFLGIHADLRSGPVKELAVKLGGDWVQVNPRAWRDRTDMTVKVGMGSGNRDERRQGIMLIGQVQEKMLAGGSTQVGPQQIYNATEELAATYGYKSIDKFMLRPEEAPPPSPPPPDPQIEIAMRQTAIMDFEAKSRFQIDQMKLELEERLKMAELTIKKAAEEAKGAEIAGDLLHGGEELDLKRRELAQKAAIEREKLDAQERMAKARPAPKAQ
jgi:hypothetical protein